MNLVTTLIGASLQLSRATPILTAFRPDLTCLHLMLHQLPGLAVIIFLLSTIKVADETTVHLSLNLLTQTTDGTAYCH